MNKLNVETAINWRSKNNYDIQGGVVVLFGGEVQGWCCTLPNPRDWRPGCIAIDDCQQGWTSTGGNPYDGATTWNPVQLDS
jgi:hypothetical protein